MLTCRNKREYPSHCRGLSALLNSLWFTMALSGCLQLTLVPSSSNWLSMTPTLALTGSLRLLMALSGSYWISPCLSLALCDSHSGSHWLSFWFTLALSGSLLLSMQLPFWNLDACFWWIWYWVFFNWTIIFEHEHFVKAGWIYWKVSMNKFELEQRQLPHDNWNNPRTSEPTTWTRCIRWICSRMTMEFV